MWSTHAVNIQESFQASSVRCVQRTENLPGVAGVSVATVAAANHAASLLLLHAAGIHCHCRHAKLFAEVDLPHGPNFNEEDVSDKPAWIQSLPRCVCV